MSPKPKHLENPYAWLSEGFTNPFELPPYPVQITVLAGRPDADSEDVEIRINNDGTVKVYRDPLDFPIATFTPDDAVLLGFLAAHLEHHRADWESFGRARYNADPEYHEEPRGGEEEHPAEELEPESQGQPLLIDGVKAFRKAG